MDEIDRHNIRVATHMAMRRAWEALKPLPEFVLIDGLPVPDFPCASNAIVKGDSRSLLIAAASVIAKVSRDRLMKELDREFPAYGFASHKGYGSRQHMKAPDGAWSRSVSSPVFPSGSGRRQYSRVSSESGQEEAT